MVLFSGHFDQLSRKQQSPVLAASAYDLQDGFGRDQVLHGGLAHPTTSRRCAYAVLAFAPMSLPTDVMVTPLRRLSLSVLLRFHSIGPRVLAANWEGSMRSTLAWALLGALGFCLGAVSLPQALDQQPLDAPAVSAKGEPGRLGAEIRDLTDQSVKSLGLTQKHAILVVFPFPGAPADRAGLRPGDVIVELEGASVGRVDDGFIPALQRLGSGHAATLVVLRGKERRTIQTALAKAADIHQDPDISERRIAAYEAIQRIFDRGTFPHEWAAMGHSLGLLYRDRDRGDRADNLEKAIAAFESALTVFTREALPWNWAALQFDLGFIYSQRVRGELADNLESTIAAYEAALTVRTRESQPHDWALTQNNLGAAYSGRTRGEPAENLEKSIAAYEAALTVRTKETTPVDWALTQNNLGIAYWNRSRGDRADNLEKAIAAYEAVLTVRRREASSLDWAATQFNLGNAYQARVRGEQADNLETAIAAYGQALTVYTREAWPREWADAQNNLGNAYQTRVRGDRAENLEKAIATFEQVLTVFTRESLPRDWGDAQNNLGNSYLLRIRGDRGENLEKAIAAFEHALTARTREVLPRDWAGTQINLGSAYKERILGSRAENLERAISALDQALLVLTRQISPQDWAIAQNNLGIVYWDRVRGDRAENLEKAVAAFEQALTVRTREALPQDWGSTQANLGGTYLQRVRGERADNLEKAVAAFEQALTILERDTLPWLWATVQNNLGVGYQDRIRGIRSTNLKKAIAAFEQALTVRTAAALPQEWAATQFNLGRAYLDPSHAEQADSQEKAIAAFEQALTIFTREALPREWAIAQNALGANYWRRVKGDRADNIEKAIVAYELALSVRTREGAPQEWAATQYLLGAAYADRIRGDRAANLKMAIVAHKAALAVRARATQPRDYLTTALSLGQTLIRAGEWAEASPVYADARETFLVLFGQGLNEADARGLIADAGTLFGEGAYVAAELGTNEKALELATEGRARLMAVALKLQALSLPPDKRRRLDELRAEIRVADRMVDSMEGAGRASAVEKLFGLRQELLGLVKDADAAEAMRGSAMVQARALAARSGAVAVPIVTSVGAKILIVTRAGMTRVDLPEVTTDRLNALVRGDSKDGKVGGWLGAYNINYLADAELDRRWPEWLAAVGSLGSELGRLLGAALDAALKDAGIRSGARIVWVPTGALGILPLGLAQDPGTKRLLADSYEIVYAPSLEALASALRDIARSVPATLAAVVNPTGDLAGTEKEGKLVASHFPVNARTLLEREQASPDAVLAALKGTTHWHFASHGTFSWDDARESALVMHGSTRLNVGNLLDTDGLGRPRLVVLSACETGLYDIERNPDEFIGLPGTFTALGAAGVLGTLWPVNDSATALLMAKFYDLHMGEGLAPPSALRQAQLWLRAATDANINAYIEGAAKKGRLEPRHVAEIDQELSDLGLKRSRNSALIEWIAPETTRSPDKKRPGRASSRHRPYAHPYFWAGFIYTGL
jgi:CHAT domain-containing protein/tetratricopeptide (TPR) repeat protein